MQGWDASGGGTGGSRMLPQPTFAFSLAALPWRLSVWPCLHQHASLPASDSFLNSRVFLHLDQHLILLFTTAATWFLIFWASKLNAAAACYDNDHCFSCVTGPLGGAMTGRSPGGMATGDFRPPPLWAGWPLTPVSPPDNTTEQTPIHKHTDHWHRDTHRRCASPVSLL